MRFCFLTKPFPIEQFTLTNQCCEELILQVIPFIAVTSLSNKVSCCCCVPRHGHGPSSLLLSSSITVSLQLQVFSCRYVLFGSQGNMLQPSETRHLLYCLDALEGFFSFISLKSHIAIFADSKNCGEITEVKLGLRIFK